MTIDNHLDESPNKTEQVEEKICIDDEVSLYDLEGIHNYIQKNEDEKKQYLGHIDTNKINIYDLSQVHKYMQKFNARRKLTTRTHTSPYDLSAQRF